MPPSISLKDGVLTITASSVNDRVTINGDPQPICPGVPLYLGRLPASMPAAGGKAVGFYDVASEQIGTLFYTHIWLPTTTGVEVVHPSSNVDLVVDRHSVFGDIIPLKMAELDLSREFSRRRLSTMSQAEAKVTGAHATTRKPLGSREKAIVSRLVEKLQSARDMEDEAEVTPAAQRLFREVKW